MSVQPQEQVARDFMARKGFDIEPASVDKLEGVPCWYFVYWLGDGDVLELEVSWEDDEWQTLVTTFIEK